ncbi:MAG: hypothetical protein ACO38Q_07820 [Aquiluna sp.]
MGVSQLHALGRNRKFYVNEETTYIDSENVATDFVKPAGTDAAVILNASFTPAQERKVRDDARASRSALEQITGKKSATWSVESYVLPSGTAGTAPDLGPLFKGAMGTETVSGGTRVTYSLNTNQDLGSFSLTQFFNETFMETLTGCYVNSMTISVAGGEEPKVTFEGESSGLYIPTTTSPSAAQLTAGESTATVDGSGTGTSFDVHAGEGENFKPGSVISVGTDTDLVVTAVSNDTITVDSSITFTDDDEVKPFAPTETVAGSPIAGILGSLTLAGNSLPITSFEVTVANNNKGISDEAFVAGTSDYVPGFRDVTGSLSIRCRRDLAIEIGKRLDFGTQAIIVTCGDTAGKKLIIEIDDAEFEVAAVDTPQSDEVVVPMNFRALATSAGEDEIVIKFE